VLHVRILGFRHTGIDEEFKRGGIRAFKEEGSLLSERDITVSGQPAWELAGELPFEGRKVTTVSHILFAGDKAYKINALFIGGDARADEQLQNCLNSFRLLNPPAPPQVDPIHPASFPLAVITISICVLVTLFATKGMPYGPRGFLAAWGLWLGIRLFRTITAPVWTSSSDINAKAACFGALLIPALCLWLLWSLYQKPQRKVHVWLLVFCAVAFWKFFVASILVFMLASAGGHSLGEAVLQWWHRSTNGALAAIDAILPLFLLVAAPFWPAFCNSQRRVKEPLKES
jgi:hypothetical protein